jgi:hypothetical protein
MNGFESIGWFSSNSYGSELNMDWFLGSWLFTGAWKQTNNGVVKHQMI